MEWIQLSEHLQNNAKLYYGIDNFPPPDNTCTWKLLFRNSDDVNSCMIENGNNVGIYMITDSQSYDNVPAIQDHFNNALLQILLMDIREKFIFGKIDKHIYKLLPNSVLETETHNVKPIRATIITKENLETEIHKNN